MAMNDSARRHERHAPVKAIVVGTRRRRERDERRAYILAAIHTKCANGEPRSNHECLHYQNITRMPPRARPRRNVRIISPTNTTIVCRLHGSKPSPANVIQRR
ncbi:hypothetical protein AVEN_15925-1 [Araneus ventricosus]|uniref:Uncharacterized protein n=1 Tax=Araneus ventricosus TaxID=182803 RepID=A0A4Y2WQV9_ARAVE|nr:hypothetical protein AVEN_15925-1 [Araneus ventricosus]